VSCAGLLLFSSWYFGKTSPSVRPLFVSGMTCDMGLSAAKAERDSAAVSAQPVSSQSKQSVRPASASETPTPPPGPAPEGMVWIPGGEFSMGADEFPDAQPWHRVRVDGFWMDRTEVTNEQFAKFVRPLTMSRLPNVNRAQRIFQAHRTRICGPDRWCSRRPLVVPSSGQAERSLPVVVLRGRRELETSGRPAERH
jgi:formylglycine-generating enzyme required for sulfatase activity